MTNSDLVIRLSALADYKGKANGGSTTTLISGLLDDYTNMYICFLSGANKGVDRIITGSNNGILTFEAVTTAIDSTTEFAICETGYLSKIESASAMVDEKFKNLGLKVELFVTPSQLNELYIYKALEVICRDRMQVGSDSDFYYTNAQYYADLFNTTFSTLKADYDANESGGIDTEENLSNQTQARFVR